MSMAPYLEMTAHANATAAAVVDERVRHHIDTAIPANAATS